MLLCFSGWLLEQSHHMNAIVRPTMHPFRKAFAPPHRPTLGSGQLTGSESQVPTPRAPLFVTVDHFFAVSPDPESLFRVFRDIFGLPQPCTRAYQRDSRQSIAASPPAMTNAIPLNQTGITTP